MAAPSPWLPRPPAPGTVARDPWLVDFGTFNGWRFGAGSPWEILSADGFPDMMTLKMQDGQLVGDGQVFGWDSENKRVITFQFRGDGVWLEHCFPPVGDGAGPDRIQEARCANMRRHDDLPLEINGRWLILARPRRFLAPQRAREVPILTVSYEAQDPAIYDAVLQSGTASVGAAEWGRPYPPGPGLTYRGPAGAAPWTWRYEGRGQGGLLAVINRGCRETYLMGRITGPVRGPMLINQTTFERLEFDIELSASEWLDIDFRRGTAMLNGVSSRYFAITRESNWFSVGPGTTFIRYLARGEVTESTFTAWWRSAW